MMLRFRYFLVVAALGCAVSIAAQEFDPGLLAKKCLAEAPTTIITLIDHNTRLDMIDYYLAGVEHNSTNAVGGDCIITSMKPYSVTFMGGNGINFQIFVLNPSSAAPIIGVIETVDTPIPDSQITLYNSRWQKIKTPVFTPPTLADWILPAYSKKQADIEEALPFIMASYSYNPDTYTLTVSNNMSHYFTASDTPAALSQIKDQLTYKWDGKRFKPVK